MNRPITFGWYLPTHGDTTAFGNPAQRMPAGIGLFEDVVAAVDRGGFSYLLMPVAPTCWEATALGGWVIARTRRVAPLIAIRAGYVNPTQSARMFATLDQLSQGRVAINLIAGISDRDTRADGIPDAKEVRYEKLEEEVQVMKLLWTSETPIHFEGRHYRVSQVAEPKPYQRPHPPFFLGGGSGQAARISARHSTVHLFWGETPESVREKGYRWLASPVYQDFLTGDKKLPCAPWGSVTRNPYGWKGPCYLLTDGIFPTYEALVDGMEWERYGPGNDHRCEHCGIHSGFEPAGTIATTESVRETVRSLAWTLT